MTIIVFFYPSVKNGVWLDAGELEIVTQKEGYLGGMLKLFK